MSNLDKAFKKEFAKDVTILLSRKEILAFIRQREKELLDEITKRITGEAMEVMKWAIAKKLEELSNE